MPSLPWDTSLMRTSAEGLARSYESLLVAGSSAQRMRQRHVGGNQFWLQPHRAACRVNRLRPPLERTESKRQIGRRTSRQIWHVGIECEL